MNIAVVILNWNGKTLLEQFLPSIIKHSNNANIYVADKDNHRIQIFNKNGSIKKNISLKQKDKFIRPVDVVFNNELNLFYITGNNNHKVMAYDYSGKLLHQWGGEGTNRGEFRYPATLSLFKNNLYVVDVLNSRT